MKRTALLCVAYLILLAVVSTPVLAGWSVVDLNPVDASSSCAYGIWNGQIVGSAHMTTSNKPYGSDHACLWTGTAASWTDLDPTGTGYSPSRACGLAGSQQVGYRYADNQPHAGYWNGSASSWVDLNPGSASSKAYGAAGGQVVGEVNNCAALWSGTSQWINLDPGWASVYPYGNGPDSQALAIADSQEVGYADNDMGECHATLWTGTKASCVDLNPKWGMYSQAVGVSAGQQVGYASTGLGYAHASLWTGTAASWLDLNPTVANQSWALGVFHGQQVGRATISGVNHASLWSGSSQSWVDLSALLPLSLRSGSSEANAIYTSSGITWIVGSANGHAVLWENTVPEPSAILTLLCGVNGVFGFMLRRGRR